jgi:hypothetical protein
VNELISWAAVVAAPNTEKKVYQNNYQQQIEILKLEKQIVKEKEV